MAGFSRFSDFSGDVAAIEPTAENAHSTNGVPPEGERSIRNSSKGTDVAVEATDQVD